MKPSLRSLALVLPLVALLTCLLALSVGPRGGDYVMAQRDVARVALGEAGLRSDVLQARIGLLANDDLLVKDMDQLRGFADELGRQAMIRPQDAAILETLHGKVIEDERALERFKSDNALLQNSLVYFDVLDARLAAVANPAMVSVLVRLGNAMLQLSRHPTPERRSLMQDRLSEVAALAGQDERIASGPDLHLFLTHGRILVQMLPAVDDDLRSLFRISTYDPRQGIRASQDARRAGEEKRARNYRLALSVTTIIVVTVLLQVWLRWLAGRRLLRQHTMIEALIADISTRFVGMEFAAYEATMEKALARLGDAFNADRAFMLTAGPTPAAWTWQRPGVDAPADWPQSLLDPVLTTVTPMDDLLSITSVKAAAPGPLIDVLRQAGIAAWCGVVLRSGEQMPGLLSFEQVVSAGPSAPLGIGLLRMAAETLQGAMQRRLALLDRLELEARLGRVRRMEALGTFASGIAHNFNNVIGAMLGHAEMAADACRPGTAAGRHVDEIRRAGERAQELVGKILEFGVRRRIAHQPVSVDSLIGETLSMLRVMLPGQVEVAVEPQAPRQLVLGDAIQLQQVLMNLIRNAAQAMAECGTITVQTDTMRLRSTQTLSHDSLPPGDYVRIRIADTGSGMDAATLASIFQPFFTTRPAGTGLGLATVREVVQDHHGAVDVRSAQHRGSAFTVWLPTAQSEAQLRSAARTGIGQTLLLLAPNRSVVLNDEEVLAALGYEPVGFHDVESARQAACADPSRFDAVMIDPLRLDAGGRAIIATIRTVLPGVPLILVLAGEVVDSARDLDALGVTATLRRPLRSAAVVATLTDCLAA